MATQAAPPAPDTDTDELRHYTTAEAAARLRISHRTLQKWTAANAVPHTRIGRKVFFREEHLLAISRMGDIDPMRRGRRAA